MKKPRELLNAFYVRKQIASRHSQGRDAGRVRWQLHQSRRFSAKRPIVKMPAEITFKFLSKKGKRDSFFLELKDSISLIKKLVLDQRRPVCLDFRQTAKISTAAMLLLYAEVDRIVRLSGSKALISCIEPQKDRCRQVLNQIGFYRLIGHETTSLPIRDDVVKWVRAEGISLDAEKIADLVSFQGQVDVEFVGDLFGGITEAVANSIEHAYTDGRGDGFRHLEDVKWWMVSQIYNSELYVLVCDLGIGVPRSLPKKFDLRKLSEYVSLVKNTLNIAHPDTQAVRLAIEIGKSRTGLSHRGKGINDALAVLNKCKFGEVFILSNRGGYSVKSTNDGKRYEKSFPLKRSIQGTIIGWKLPLRESKNEINDD
jgi:hypothetical protein